MLEFYGDEKIAHNDVVEANRANWDDRAQIHKTSYGIEAYVKDPTRVSYEIRKDLPILLKHLGRTELTGLDVAHLQCHIGTDTISLARCGAQVFGVDFSPASLEVARQLAQDAHTPVEWICSDVMEAASAVGRRVDVVYTSVGTVCWYEDLARWANQIAKLLKPGGIFYIRDGHPMLYIFDGGAEAPVAHYRYFANGHALSWNEDGTYLGEGTVEHSRNFEFPHAISEIMQALIDAGLCIEFFDEGKELSWCALDGMIKIENDQWVFPEKLREIIPCTFTIVARKPAA